MVTDDRQQDIALVDLSGEMLAKIDAQGNGVDVHEDGAGPEVALQFLMEPPGDVRTVVTSVGDEELGHGRGLTGLAWMNPPDGSAFTACSWR